MKQLTDKQIESFYKIDDAIRDIEQNFESMQDGKIKIEPRIVIPTGPDAQSMLYMPAVDLESELSIVKIASISPQNKGTSIPATQAKILFTDIKDGQHTAVIDAYYLTRLRTAALSGIASKYLSREDSTTLGIIGTGGMAYEQMLANMAVRPIDTVYLYNRTFEKAEQFYNEVKDKHPNITFKVVKDVADLTKNADIINCQTRSTEYVFDGNDVKPGTHINGVGSYQPDMREIDIKAIERASKVVFDDVEGVKEEAGEFIEADKNGILKFEDIYSDLMTLSLNRKLARDNNEEITVFKSVGAAYYDLAVAKGVYEKELR